MKKVKVLCSFFVEVELSDEDYERRHFIIEDNGCPATGIVGQALNDLMEWSEESGCCWACKASGQNRIVLDEIDLCRHVEIKV